MNVVKMLVQYEDFVNIGVSFLIHPLYNDDV